MFLPAGKFVLNSTCSASTRHSLAFVFYGHKLVLSIEHVIHSLVDITVFSVAVHF